MLNDRKASELISRSFRGELTEEEARQVDEHIASNSQSEAFAKISRVIQNSASDIAVMSEAGEESVAPGLSTSSKARLRESIQQASRRYQNESPTADVTIAPWSHRESTFLYLLRELGQVDQQQVSSVLEDWTLASQATLGRFLVEKGLITEATRQEVDDEVERVMKAGSRSSSSTSSPSPSATHLRQGTRKLVSRFSLVRKLGEGGLGRVWLARDEKLKRTVAIKEMSQVAAESPKAWQRFRREAEITGHLEHPNVVPLYQFGDDPSSGNPFYAMRFVGKRTLADAIIEYHERRQAGSGDALGLHRLLTAFLGVCQAIAYAHSRGVVHRDLKPENVALDNFGQVIVLDWGLAKMRDEGELGTHFTMGPETDDSVLTQTLDGAVIGTPLYMSPEQAAGDLDNVDELTDVYGLGAILFSILTGCAPHENSSTSTDGEIQFQDLLKSIAEAVSPRPRDYNADVSGDLDTICMKAMSRQRYARHQSASELADDVERWMAGQDEKRQEYENMRMEGRELRANLGSSIRDLGTNVRFMSKLPPIQGIIDVRSGTSGEEETVWRERLSTIFRGLLQANSDYAAVAYCSVVDGSFQEIVRVERHSTDHANIRNVPLSRLSGGAASEFMRSVMEQKPEEVHIALVGELTPCMIQDLHLVAGVPVFDEKTEEAFGFVVIECRFYRLLDEHLLNRVRYARQILVLDRTGKILSHDILGCGRIDRSAGRPVTEIVPEFEPRGQCCAKLGEYVDKTDRELYATRLELIPRDSELTIVLLRNPFEEA